MRKLLLILFCVSEIITSAQAPIFYKEKYRPQFHFSPAIHWTNDPNGLVYNNGEYHLFYQFNPFGNRWGHMTWGHAISTDLIHWEHLPIAIPEEKDTMIFSGSCVVDKNNSSGFAGNPSQSPMVAIYTAHIDNHAGYIRQSQHLAYSVDNGRTWTKYDHNPVLDINKTDFRDPKVFWYEPQQKWIMAVMWPAERFVQFYDSKNLKEWNLMSTFGPAGDTSGIWECPDLFRAPVQDEPGKYKWVFMHSPSPYMQYFIGEFDGTKFTNENPTGKIYRPDYGPDYYAAIAFNNLPLTQQPVSIGWVNNWNYANDIPTTPWKSAMSLPRKLSVKKIDDEWILIQEPVDEIKKLRVKAMNWKNKPVIGSSPLPVQGQMLEAEISFRPASTTTSGIRIAKSGDQFIEIGYDAEKGTVYVDRTHSGEKDFHPSFPKFSRYETPVRLKNGKISLHLFFDKSITEVFVNGGEAVFTTQLFPQDRQVGVELFSNGKQAVFESVNYWQLKSIW